MQQFSDTITKTNSSHHRRCQRVHRRRTRRPSQRLQALHPYPNRPIRVPRRAHRCQNQSQEPQRLRPIPKTRPRRPQGHPKSRPGAQRRPQDRPPRRRGGRHGSSIRDDCRRAGVAVWRQLPG